MQRNVFRYKQLVEAAAYIRAALTSSGFNVQRHQYQVNGQTCENLEAQIVGAEQPDDILLIGAHYDSAQGSPGANDAQASQRCLRSHGR